MFLFPQSGSVLFASACKTPHHMDMHTHAYIHPHAHEMYSGKQWENKPSIQIRALWWTMLIILQWSWIFVPIFTVEGSIAMFKAGLHCIKETNLAWEEEGAALSTTHQQGPFSNDRYSVHQGAETWNEFPSSYFTDSSWSSADAG